MTFNCFDRISSYIVTNKLPSKYETLYRFELNIIIEYLTKVVLYNVVIENVDTINDYIIMTLITITLVTWKKKMYKKN